MIKIGLIQFPGSNCERETALAVKRADMQPVELMWNEPLDQFRQMDGYILIGGFSYEDRSRAGIIAALQPVVNEIRIQSEAGKPVLGICNGAQILVESGLVPGLQDLTGQIALTENKRIKDQQLLGTGFYNAWVNMRVSSSIQPNAFTRHLSTNDLIHLPVAHAQGRFVMSDLHWQQLEQQGLAAFQYCNEAGTILADFPINPNGSVGNLAAIINKAGNVMAMMPHPERTPNGDAIFSSMREYIEARVQTEVHACEQQNLLQAMQPYIKKPKSHQYLIQLNITDNQAMTVQNTLRRLGIPVTVQRYVHWEVECESGADELSILEQIQHSGVLYCDRKEQVCQWHDLPKSQHEIYCLVRAKEDVMGQEAYQTLTKYYGLNSLQAVRHGVVWQFTSANSDMNSLQDRIFSTNIIGNPYAHECYQFNHNHLSG